MGHHPNYADFLVPAVVIFALIAWLTRHSTLNRGLYLLHLAFFSITVAAALVMLLVALSGQNRTAIAHGYLVPPLFLTFSVLHGFAALGARKGKRYGRIITRIVGTIWLIGIPIGTALGIIVWLQTGKKRWQAAQPPSETLVATP